MHKVSLRMRHAAVLSARAIQRDLHFAFVSEDAKKTKKTSRTCIVKTTGNLNVSDTLSKKDKKNQKQYFC